MIVEAPDGKVIQFPEGMSEKDISSAMESQYPAQKKSIPARLVSGFMSNLSSLLGPRPEDVVSQFHEREKQTLGQRMAPAIKTLKRPQDIPGNILNEAIDNPLNTAMMFLPGKAAARLAESKLPEKVYQGAARFKLDPHTFKSKGAQAAIDERMERLKEGVQTRTRMNEEGLVRADTLQKDTDARIEAVIREGVKKGEEIDFVKMVDEGLKNAYDLAAEGDAPDQGKKIIDKYRNAILRVNKETGEVGRKTLNLQEAQRMKQILWKYSKFTGANSSAMMADLMQAERKGIGNRIANELEERYPALKTLNPQDATRIDLRNQVFAHVNEDLSSMPHAALIAHPNKLGMYASIQARTIGHPRVREALAFALDKARAAAQGLKSPIYPQVVEGEPTPPPPSVMEGQILTPQLLGPTGAGPEFGMRPAHLIPSEVAGRKLLTAPPPDFTQPRKEGLFGEPFTGIKTLPPGEETLPSGLYGGPKSSFAPQPTALETALGKHPSMRTYEEHQLVREAQKIAPRITTSMPTPPATEPVVVGESFTPKEKVKFGAKGGVIGRPKGKTEGDVTKAIKEESKKSRKRIVEPSE